LERKAISRIVLALLLISVLSSAFSIQPVKAEPVTGGQVWAADEDGDGWIRAGSDTIGVHWELGPDWTVYQKRLQVYADGVLTVDETLSAWADGFTWTWWGNIKYFGTYNEIHVWYLDKAKGYTLFKFTLPKPAHEFPIYPSARTWWFDYATMSVFWRADLAQMRFLVDFDGDHSTAALSDWGGWHWEYGTFSSLGVVKIVADGGYYGWAFKIGELKIDQRDAHIRETVPGHLTEWFYFWVPKTIPPTDWVVGLKRSDGINPIPVTSTFWYSEDGGATWNSFTPYAALPFIWPVPSVGKENLLQDYAEWNPYVQKYHTALDIRAPDVPVVATASGLVEKIFRIEGGPPNPARPEERWKGNNNMQNVVILNHSLPDGKTVYSLYAHLGVIDSNLREGQTITAGHHLGTAGVWFWDKKELTWRWLNHVHFEIKDEEPVRHNPKYYPSGSTKWYWGYTPYHPDNYGYHDPGLFFHQVSDIDPIIVKVNTDTMNVRRGPSTEYPVQATIHRGQKFVALRISELTADNWYQIWRTGSGWDTSEGWVSAKYVEKEPFPGGIIIKSPADLVVVDPNGFTITKELGEVPGMHYIEFDLDGDGEVDDMVAMLERKIGDYSITAIPEPEALPTDTYTLEVWADNVIIALAENVQISNIPSQPYIVRSTETEIFPIIPATVNFDPDTLNLKSVGQWVTVYMELPVGHGYDTSQIDVSSLKLNGTVPALSEPTQIGDYDGDGIADLMGKFDRAAIIQWLGAIDYSQDAGKSYTIKVTITGTVNGVKFKGSDITRILKN